jgi:hypothetical protein
MTELDVYLDDLSSRLHVGRRERARILAEVRDHLDDSLAHNEKSGVPRAEAIVRALDAFGPPATLAASFNAASGTRAMRRAPIAALAAGFTVFGGLLLAGKAQTHTTASANASVPTQVSFFFAVLAFEIAVVAGMCAGSRALAVWRSTVVPGNDRRFVRQASRISMCALGLAALGWAVTTGLALGRPAEANTLTLVVGASIMLIGAALGIVAALRLRVNPSDDSPDDNAIAVGFFGCGEQCIGFVRRHPVVSCTTIAALSIFPAMAHAETTFAGALPWGLIQAATVVVAFAILGRPLELRASGETTALGT